MFTHAHVEPPPIHSFYFFRTIKIRLRNKPEIDLSSPLISLIFCHVSFSPFLSLTLKQDDWSCFQRLLSSLEAPPLAFIALWILVAPLPKERKTLGVCCPHVISSLWRLTGRCCLCQYWSIVMFTLTEGGFGFDGASGGEGFQRLTWFLF